MVNYNTALSEYFQSDPHAFSIFAGKMCEAGIISAGLRDDPVYNNIETQFTSMLSFNETKEELEKDCQAFLTALASQGRSFARISKRIAQDWRDSISSKLNISNAYSTVVTSSVTK